MRGLMRLLQLLLLITVFAGCTAPVGFIGGSTALDDLWAIPNRVVYQVNNAFRRGQDVSVFLSHQGRVTPLPIEDVTIQIDKDPFSDPEVLDLIDNGEYPLTTAGRKIIVVTYKGLEARYSIEVISPYGNGNGNGNGNGGGSGINIIWL